MIRYSKTKVVILIIVVLVLWIAVRCGISLPLSARSGAHVTIDGDDLTIHSRGCDLVVGPSSDDLVHVEGAGETRTISQGTVRTYADDVVTVLVPASATGLFLDATGSIDMTGMDVDSLELATIDGKLSLSGCSARQASVTTIDGDVCITGSSFPLLSIHAIDGDIDIAQCDVDDIDGTTVDGDITISLSSFQTISVSTVDGDIILDADGLSEATLTLDDSSANRTIHGLSDKRVEASTVSGKVEILNDGMPSDLDDTAR